MIQGVKVINHESKAFDFLLNDTMNSGLYIQNIDGLGYPPSSISTSSVFNYGISKYGYTEKQPRNIVITFGISSNGYYTVEQARRFIYEMFPQDTNLYMEFKSDETNYKITGYVETITPTIFDSKESVQVSVICPNPYFYSGGKTIITSEDAGNNFQFTEWFEQLNKEEGEAGTLSAEGLTFTIPDDSPSNFSIDLKYRSVEVYIPDKYDFSFFNIDLYYFFLETWNTYPSFDSYVDNVTIDITISDASGITVPRIDEDSKTLWKAPYKNGKSYYTPNGNTGYDYWRLTFGYSDIKYLIGSGTSEESTGSICIGLSRDFIRRISGGEFTIHLNCSINGFDQLKETTNEVRKFRFKCNPILNKTYYFYNNDVYYSPREIMSIKPTSTTYKIGDGDFVEHKKPVSFAYSENESKRWAEVYSRISNPTGLSIRLHANTSFNKAIFEDQNGKIIIEPKSIPFNYLIDENALKENFFKNSDIVIVNDYEDQNVYEEQGDKKRSLLSTLFMEGDFIGIKAGYNKITAEIFGVVKVKTDKRYYRLESGSDLASISAFSSNSEISLLSDVWVDDTVGDIIDDGNGDELPPITVDPGEVPIPVDSQDIKSYNYNAWSVNLLSKSSFVGVDVYEYFSTDEAGYLGHFTIYPMDDLEEKENPDVTPPPDMVDGMSYPVTAFYQIPITDTLPIAMGIYMTRSKTKQNNLNEYEENGYFYSIWLKLVDKRDLSSTSSIDFRNPKSGEEQYYHNLKVDIKDLTKTDSLFRMYYNLGANGGGRRPSDVNEVHDILYLTFNYAYYVRTDNHLDLDSYMYSYENITDFILTVSYDEMYDGF